MTHYETLGVPPSASEAEIKRAYRKRASKAHPDRQNGDDNAMAQLNKAYEVLGDPTRRIVYDRTGQDQQAPVEVAAKGALIQFFSAALQQDAPNLIVAVREMLDQQQQNALQQALGSKGQINKLLRRRDKIKTRAGQQNLVSMIIDEAVRQHNAVVEQAENELAVNASAKLMLNAYDSDETVEVVMPSGTTVYWAR